MTLPAIPGLTRHFVTLGNRQLHYRRMGRGPALVALHRLPRSSRDLIPFMQAAADKFTVIAPDFAGYGNSWQLTKAADAVQRTAIQTLDYVEDVEALLAELGIKTCALYGERFGAAVALQLTIRSPKRFAAAALDSLSVATSDAERAEARNAYPAFEAKWDGSHFSWLWSFLREENCFHPWWVKRLDARVVDDMPPPEELHARLIQFLADGRAPAAPGGRPITSLVGRHGRGYAAGLLAVLDFKPLAHLVNVSVPTLITGPRSFEKDVKLANGSPRSKDCAVKQVDAPADARRAAIAFFLDKAGRVPDPSPPSPAKPIPGRLWSEYIAVTGGQLHLRANDDIESPPLLIQHDAASSISTIEPIARNLVGRRTVLAFDLPGSGDSDNLLPTDGLDRDVEVEVYAEAISAALDTLGLKQVDFYGMWGGGFVGLDLAIKHPDRVRRLVMSNLFQHDGAEQAAFLANYTPPVDPVWHGGHLMQAWLQMRDQGIYYPWFDRSAKGVIKREPFLATDMVHERVCSLLKAGNMYRAAYRSHFRYRTYERLARSPVPTLIATTKWDPNNPQTEAAAKAAPNAKFQYLDEDFTKWGESFLPFLESR